MLWKRVRFSANGILALLLGVSPTLAATADTPPGPEKLTAPSCETFGFDFYRQLVSSANYKPESDTNIAISPFSLASVLEMLRLGTIGEAHAQLTAVLHSDAPGTATAPAIGKPGSLESKGATLSVANSLWIDTEFQPKPDYLRAVDAEFGNAVFSLEFGQAGKAAHRINGWISDNTAGHIKDLLTPKDIPATTAMIVANAVYFKGTWETPFDPKRTAEEPFHLASQKDIPAQMMHRVGEFEFAEVDGVKLLGLPYEGNSVSMVLVLPERGAAAMTQLEGQLSGTWFANALSKLAPQRVAVALPRFTFACEPSGIVEVLKALGLTRIFKPSDDFEPISDKGPLYVGLFKHKAWLAVNEQGTEAAAATVAGIRAMAIPAKPTEFIADHPFLFVIRHNATGTPLFVGRVSNPATK